MSDKVCRLPSKIVQIVNIPNSNYYSAWLLCEDGSLWVKANTASPIFDRVHPPHEPPTQSADLAEALEVLRRLWTYTEPTSEVSEEAYKDVHDFLEKHGA